MHALCVDCFIVPSCMYVSASCIINFIGLSLQLRVMANLAPLQLILMESDWSMVPMATTWEG